MKVWQLHTSMYSSFDLSPRQKSFFWKDDFDIDQSIVQTCLGHVTSCPVSIPLPRMWIHFVQDDYPSPEYYSSIFKTIKICSLFQSCDHHVNKITQLDWEKVTFVNLLNSNADTEQIVTQKLAFCGFWPKLFWISESFKTSNKYKEFLKT